MQIEQLQKLVNEALEDLKAQDVTVIDVKGKTSMTDMMMIATGTSSRHVKSIADNVAMEAKKHGVQPLGVEGDDANAEWVLVDLGDIVIHVMQEKIRDFYQLEKLWSMAEDE